MWKSTEYCNITSSWACNHDPSHSASYTFAQNADNWIEENGSSVDDVPAGDKLICTQEQDGVGLELSCACKPHHSVRIVGVVVLSEARTVECYTCQDGYLNTYKGTEVKQPAKVTEGTESGKVDVKLYYTVLRFDEKLNDVVIKFLGFGSKQVLTVIKLEFVLVCVDEQKSQPAGIDMSKVKGYLSSMGGNVSEGAMNMLKSVEQYQATQMSGFGGLQSLLASHSHSVPGQPPDNRLSALLSMITGNRNETKSPELSSQNRAQDSHDYSQNTSNDANNSADCHDDNHGEDSMFEMLKGICGKVSAMRVSQEQKSAESTEQSSKEQEEDSKQLPEISTESIPDLGAVHIEALKSVFEKTASEIVTQSEERIMKYLDVRLTDMEARINNKLDSMLKALQKNGHPPITDTDHTT